MKKTVLAAALVTALGGALATAQIDGKVIHHYTFLGVGYGYLHDVADSVNAHGVLGEASFEEQNFVLSVSGSHFWADDDLGLDADLTAWTVAPSVGYVVRLADNHVNIIPRFGAAYAELRLEAPGFGSASDGSWSITPGGTVSYAFNNRLALAGSYSYVYNLDAEEGGHAFSVGPTVALFREIGVSARALFTDDEGFTGIVGAVEFHF